MVERIFFIPAEEMKKYWADEFKQEPEVVIIHSEPSLKIKILEDVSIYIYCLVNLVHVFNCISQNVDSINMYSLITCYVQFSCLYPYDNQLLTKSRLAYIAQSQ